MKTFNIEEIRNYILSQDSLGDVLYNLNEQSIEQANTIEKEIILDRNDNTIEEYDLVYLNNNYDDFYVVNYDARDKKYFVIHKNIEIHLSDFLQTEIRLV